VVEEGEDGGDEELGGGGGKNGESSSELGKVGRQVIDHVQEQDLVRLLHTLE